MRLSSVIWASENIATNTPDIYENYMTIFETLLHDADDKVRMEVAIRTFVNGAMQTESLLTKQKTPCLIIW